MLKSFLHRYVRGFAKRYNYDASYMHEIADISTAGFIRLALMQTAGGQWQSNAPRDPYHAAGIAAVLVEDCGPCVQIATDIAVEAGVPPQTIAALLAGAPTDPDAQLGFEYGRALIGGSDEVDTLREAIERKWGKAALLAISLHALTGRNFPVIKRAMGHAKACQRVRVGTEDILVNRMLKAA
jgi:AhpD family alkylhydroperoxidase